jgi:hypothetical protein
VSRFRSLLTVLALVIILVSTILFLPRQPLPTSDASAITPLTTADWMIVVVSPTSHLVEALGSLETLMQNPQVDDPNWRDAIGQQIDTIQVAYFEVYRTAAPDAIRAIHVALLDAMRDCAAMAAHLRRAIDERNPDEARAARALLVSCGGKMDGASRMMDGLQRR